MPVFQLRLVAARSVANVRTTVASANSSTSTVALPLPPSQLTVFIVAQVVLSAQVSRIQSKNMLVAGGVAVGVDAETAHRAARPVQAAAAGQVGHQDVVAGVRRRQDLDAEFRRRRRRVADREGEPVRLRALTRPRVAELDAQLLKPGRVDWMRDAVIADVDGAVDPAMQEHDAGVDGVRRAAGAPAADAEIAETGTLGGVRADVFDVAHVPRIAQDIGGEVGPGGKDVRKGNRHTSLAGGRNMPSGRDDDRRECGPSLPGEGCHSPIIGRGPATAAADQSCPIPTADTSSVRWARSRRR